MSVREPGFYWVRLELDGEGEREVVAEPGEYGGDRVFFYDGSWHNESTVQVLSDRLEPPPKYVQPAPLHGVHGIDATGNWWSLQVLSVLNGFVRVQLYYPVKLKLQAATKGRSRASKSPKGRSPKTGPGRRP